MLVVAPKPVATDDPAWTPVLGAEVRFRPIDRAMMRRARRAAIKAIGEGEAESEASPEDQMEELGDALSYALLQEGVAEWRGVVIEVAEGDSVTVAPLDLTPDNLTLVLTDPITFEAFDAAYVIPFVLRERERAAPGNGSAASPNGTGEAATRDSDIATSPAAPAPAGAARNAPTSSRKPKRTRKKASGAS